MKITVIPFNGLYHCRFLIVTSLTSLIFCNRQFSRHGGGLMMQPRSRGAWQRRHAPAARGQPLSRLAVTRFQVTDDATAASATGLESLSFRQCIMIMIAESVPPAALPGWAGHAARTSRSRAAAAAADAAT